MNEDGCVLVAVPPSLHCLSPSHPIPSLCPLSSLHFLLLSSPSALALGICSLTPRAGSSSPGPLCMPSPCEHPPTPYKSSPLHIAGEIQTELCRTGTGNVLVLVSSPPPHPHPRAAHHPRRALPPSASSPTLASSRSAPTRDGVEVGGRRVTIDNTKERGGHRRHDKCRSGTRQGGGEERTCGEDYLWRSRESGHGAFFAPFLLTFSPALIPFSFSPALIPFAPLDSMNVY
ncbi:hypothetical protein B0H13DRAFT_2335042 [Mycena leptocephala]|nr:hypothetical protein B0H13DRAFT_2335042 [Mycena leptocephala]